MIDDNLIEVGRIHKVHGLEGELNVSFEAFFLPFLSDMKALFLIYEGKYIPYFPEHFHEWQDGNGALKFDELQSKEDAKPFSGKSLFVQGHKFEGLEEASKKPVGNQVFIGFEGWSKGQMIGLVKDVVKSAANDIIILSYKSNELLIPFVDEMIERLDEDKRQIHFILPDNYLETFS